MPGATLGVLGGGQLGRMFAIAARQMGYRVITLDPGADSPTGQVADEQIMAAFDDQDAIAGFARRVDVVTYEFENVPSQSIETAARFAPVRPGPLALHVSQHRAREKGFFAERGLPVTPFATIEREADIAPALAGIGCPAIMKTATLGYDGKGQRRVDTAAEALPAWQALGSGDAVLEQLIDFRGEVSVVGVRGSDGSFACYGPLWNEHSNHILDLTTAPADLPAGVAQQARDIAAAVLEALEVVGVLCVEFFLTGDNTLLINEVAPRPHNSGHLTIDAFATCQFQQQVRAICELPLGSTEQLRPACMANLLGEQWEAGEPDFAAALATPGVNLHLYGKTEARAGRKMGHLVALADTAEAAREHAIAARAALTRR